MIDSIDLLESIYPIGSLYFSMDSASPAVIIGGTWVQIVGRCIRGATNTDVGGSDTHKLTINEMPSHCHTMYGLVKVPSGSYANVIWGTRGSDKTQDTTWTGGGAAHNNLPAYQNMYIWYRTA